MSPNVIQSELQAEPFKPFVVVTTSGDRYEVRHPELAIATKQLLFIFERDGKGKIDLPVKIGYAYISALEPIEQAA